MNRNVRPVGLATVTILSAALGGCFERPPDIEMHEPGVYQGPVDPYLEVSATPAQAERLMARLKQVQTDR